MCLRDRAPTRDAPRPERAATFAPQAVAFASSHPGWVDTPAVDAAYGTSKKYLEPMRTPWQGAEGQCWLCVCEAGKLEPGAFYLDRSPQRKHLAGLFFGEGTATKNTAAEAAAMVRDLDALAARVAPSSG